MRKSKTRKMERKVRAKASKTAKKQLREERKTEKKELIEKYGLKGTENLRLEEVKKMIPKEISETTVSETTPQEPV